MLFCGAIAPCTHGAARLIRIATLLRPRIALPHGQPDNKKKDRPKQNGYRENGTQNGEDLFTIALYKSGNAQTNGHEQRTKQCKEQQAYYHRSGRLFIHTTGCADFNGPGNHHEKENKYP